MKNKNFSFLHDISDDDRILLSRVLDWTSMAEEKYITKFSSFLDERQCGLCRQVLESEKYENYTFWGGYDDAERQILCVYAPYSDVEKEVFPLKAVTYKYRKTDKLSHRDFLGSLMALQITRDCVGDIIVGEGQACAFVRDTVADEALGISKIGRVGVKSSLGFEKQLIPKHEFREISGTVASMRTDCIVSMALRVSREKAAALIKNSSVEVNCAHCDSVKYLLKPGDKFSVRGYGKFLFKSADGMTKKDRVHITICKYI